jgi:DNA mismatch repair protein MutL
MIRVLDKSVSDKIAAGEVIERPLSVIKELVENSVDAGAGTITVEIKNGGKTYMRVTDDGCGIPQDQVGTAFLRHATSKIEKVNDLASIGTLGFRGEALASIAAVTRTTMITKTRDEKTGRRLTIYGGQTVEDTAAGCPDGTTIVVTDLFYNTPARREFLRADAAESAQIINFVSEMALSFCSVKFQMINNGKILFTSTGSGDLKSTIDSVYMRREYDDLVPLSYSSESCEVSGYISRPSLSRPSRREQFFFVNGRVVDSKVIEKGISKGYRERLFEGRFPVAFIMVNVDPADVDVNIHPNKREVRFHDEQSVISAVENAVRNALAEDKAVIDFTDYFVNKEEKDTEQKKSTEEKEIDKETINILLSTKRESENKVLKEKDVVQESIDFKDKGGSGQASISDDTDSNFTDNGSVNLNKNIVNQNDVSDTKSEQAETDHAAYEGGETLPFDIYPETRPFDFSDLKVRDIIFDTYITATAGDDFYLIDQHAAHERVRYEKLVSSYLEGEKAVQPLLTPVTIDVPFSQMEGIDEITGPLISMGYSIEQFGPNTLIIREIPAYMTITEAESFARDYISQQPEYRGWNKVVVDKLIMRSCKGAVKANDVLSMDEAVSLIKQLSKCRNPFSCPHGRPTFIRFSKYRIETFFKRIQ